MANDPNRDLLPVKEDISCRTGKGLSDRIDHQILVKLPRCELEDRLLRLLDEQTQLKKLLNNKEEKIKRLGTKLLRVINEKKSGRKNLDENKETEDLHLRIIELEHENYTLKDKNIVLKQQLASHSRLGRAIRSPLRSSHTSPLVSVRQSASVPNEVVYDSSSKNAATESQLQEAEMHVKQLNDEIRSLHSKIDSLQQELEKSCLDNRKTKVTENIELIRLQRSLKQQAIQIAALQAQVKNSENNQKILREELIKAHHENDEALQLVSIKHSEILSLNGQLEEKNLNKVKEDDLKERINNLTKERDSLKERINHLMKALDVKNFNIGRGEALEKELKEERKKNEELKKLLKECQIHLKKFQSTRKNKEEFKCCCEETPNLDTDRTSIATAKENSDYVVVDNNTNGQSQKETNIPSPVKEKKVGSIFAIKQTSIDSGMKFINSSAAFKSDTKIEALEMLNEKGEMCCAEVREEKYLAERIKLQRELEFVKEMLRTQTALCKAQENQIDRLTHDLRVNDEKIIATQEQMDKFFKMFENLEYKPKTHDKTLASDEQDTTNLENASKLESESDSKLKPKSETEVSKQKEADKRPTPGSSDYSAHSNHSSKVSGIVPVHSIVIDSQESEIEAETEVEVPAEPKIYSESKAFPDLKVFSEPKVYRDGKLHADSVIHVVTEENSSFLPNLEEAKSLRKRFVENNFLDSSEEEITNEEKIEKGPLMKKLNDQDGEVMSKSGEQLQTVDGLDLHNKKSSSQEAWFDASNGKKKEDPKLRKFKRKLTAPTNQQIDFIEITVLWIQLDVNRPVWKNDKIKLVFVEISCLGMTGIDMETPQSFRKPKSNNEKCEINFTKKILITDEKKESLKSSLLKGDVDLIILKVISEPEKDYEDCEDIGVCAVTAKEVSSRSNRGPFKLPIRNMKEYKEVIGTIAVKINVADGIIAR